MGGSGVEIPGRRVTREVQIRRPSSLGQLDALLSQGVVRIELSLAPGEEGMGLVLLVDAGEVGRSVDAFVSSCEEAGLELVSPAPSRDAGEEDDELWEIRGW